MDLSTINRFSNFNRPKGLLKLRNPDDFYAYWIPGSMHGFNSLTGMYHGTPTSTGVTFGSGERGCLASLDGATSTRIDCGAINVAGLTEFTITAVIHMDGSGTDEHTIFSNWDNGVNSGMMFVRVDPSLSNQVEFHVCREANTEISVAMSDIALTTNKTHIVTCRFNSIDGSGLTGFRDDIKSGTSTATSAALDASATVSNTYLGNSPHNSADGLTGGIYAVMFRKKALSDAEVFSLHRDWWKDLERGYSKIKVGVVSGAQTITLTGIGSAEVYGASKINMNIALAGMPTDEAHGASKLNINILPSGIPSDEAYGQNVLNLNIQASGIATAESYGSIFFNQNILPTSLASDEAYGSSKLNLNLSLSGVPSDEAHGTATISLQGALQITCTGIPSDEAHGTSKLNMNILPASVASLEAYGVSQLNQNIVLVGIASAEAFGDIRLNQLISMSGVPSGESYGTQALNMNILTVSLDSQEAYGNPVINQIIALSGIPTNEAYGTLVLLGGATAIGYIEATIRVYPALDSSILSYSAVDSGVSIYPAVDASISVKH